MTATGKMKVGYFTQYQVEELDTDDTPLEHMTRTMKGATPAAVRAQLGRFGFSGDKATTKVGKLSGGERARLALALITRDAPHLLILDEPTNHLDVDAREALVQALNDYTGAVRAGQPRPPHGRTDRRPAGAGRRRHRARVRRQPRRLHRLRPEGRRRRPTAKATRSDKKAAAAARERDAGAAQDGARAGGRDRAKLTDGAQRDRPRDVRSRRRRAALARLTMSDLMKRRAEVSTRLEAAEAKWLEASEALESVAA